MNVYFLVEGKTEKKVYPKWLSYFSPGLERVDSPADAVRNNYYLVSGGGGYPSILRQLENSISDVNTYGNYDFFVLVIDTDNLTAHQRVEKIESFIGKNDIRFNACEFVIISQVVCMETWFLGNRRIYPSNPDHEFMGFSTHYDVSQNDPEEMKNPAGYPGSIGNYHYRYLKAMLAGKGVNYTKKYPRDVTEPHYIGALQDRINSDPGCLGSMRELFGFFSRIARVT